VTVTGRTYTRTRPRGYAPWSPHPDTQALLDEINQQLELWAGQMPLTARQIFYGLIGRGCIDKTERTYAKVTEILNRARRCGLVSWDAIRDDGARYTEPYHHHSVATFWETVEDDATGFRFSRQRNQQQHIEVWCEAAGMVPQLQKVASPYGVGVATSGGFDSTTAKYDSAQRFLARDVPTVVLHVGDFDPSGCSIIDSAAEDITAFCNAKRWDHVGFVRLAVTLEQIVELGLPTALPKKGDRRGERMDATVQAEAIPPAVLARIVRERIEEIMNMDILRTTLELEAEEREELTEFVQTLRLQHDLFNYDH
jgi:hypothetical protein